MHVFRGFPRQISKNAGALGLSPEGAGRNFVIFTFQSLVVLNFATLL